MEGNYFQISPLLPFPGLLRLKLKSRKLKKNYLFSFWPHWVFIAASRLCLVVLSRCYSSCGAQASHRGGFSCCGTWAPGV